MSEQHRKKYASQNIINLYCLIGEAVCTVQLLEDALSTSITLKKEVKKPGTIPLEVANQLREKYRSYTLGNVINLIRNENLFSESLQESLKNFVLERNWLIHKSIQNENEALSESNKQRIKSTSDMARALLESVETDLIQYSSSVGVDMATVQASIQKHYLRHELN
ncbi:MAG TPA: hypothetical protein VHA13_00310 [Gammaproteobacteria bacterium]|nr:hypothetical protein [Gammaproteobacteria bacterium]